MPHDQPVIAVETGDGHRFELIRAGSATGAAAMLWLPGMGISARRYIPFALELARGGLEVFIHEWRGAGSSSRRAGRGMDWGYKELLEEDLQAAIHAIQAATGQGKIMLGGHSLGAQFACLAAAVNPRAVSGLVLVAAGAPYWRRYPMLMKLLLPLVFIGFPLISSLAGYYPGRRLGFAGNEARGVIRDWASTGWTGRYRPAGVNTDLEAAMAEMGIPILTLRMADDRFAPHGSLDWLRGKLPGCAVTVEVLDAEILGAEADHFGWLQRPGVIADRILVFLEAIADTRQAEHRW